MQRKKLAVWTLGGFLVAGVAALALVLLVYHEPTFYRRAEAPPGPARKTRCDDLAKTFALVLDRFADPADPNAKRPTAGWSCQFTADQINSFLAEELEKGFACELARYGISDPRVAIEADRLRVGFRYGTGLFSTIVSLDFRVWLAPREVNVVALEILGRRAGALPISAQFFFDELTELAKSRNIDITWYRYEGNPVAILRFQSNRLRPAAQLRSLEVQPDAITIGGAPLALSPTALD